MMSIFTVHYTRCYNIIHCSNGFNKYSYTLLHNSSYIYNINCHHVTIFYNGHFSCSQTLIQFGPMYWLKGSDVEHYFNEKRVIPNWVFYYLLVCIRHDDIVHKIDATGFMIFVPTYFYVLTPAFTSVHMLHIPLYILTTVCTVHTKKSEVQPVL
jgi:hypothetical protein